MPTKFNTFQTQHVHFTQNGPLIQSADPDIDTWTPYLPQTVALIGVWGYFPPAFLFICNNFFLVSFLIPWH